MNIAVLFHAARFSDESPGAYHARRKAQKTHLKRLSFAHVSARVRALPPKGEDANTDTAIMRGAIRKVQDTGMLDAKGRMLRIGVEKGVAFEYHEGRETHKAAVRAARKHPGAAPFRSAVSNSTRSTYIVP